MALLLCYVGHHLRQLKETNATTEIHQNRCGCRFVCVRMCRATKATCLRLESTYDVRHPRDHSQQLYQAVSKTSHGSKRSGGKLDTLFRETRQCKHIARSKCNPNHCNLGFLPFNDRMLSLLCRIVAQSTMMGGCALPASLVPNAKTRAAPTRANGRSSDPCTTPSARHPCHPAV